MFKTMTAIALAGLVATGAVIATPQPAQARHGGAVAAGVIGGLAAGAIIGSALSRPAYGYYGGPVYYGPRCFWTRQRVWGPYGHGWRRVRVCR